MFSTADSHIMQIYIFLPINYAVFIISIKLKEVIAYAERGGNSGLIPYKIKSPLQTAF